ncbi:amino acid ABC transporter ATP-binding protein [Aquicella lusitana]|uniref:Amino acid ABC transporter ATP-binding protein (PAAT family) n=1 Tax=Aquicella lusitana TaxID=254246 RepID=A0A370GFG2_9COXI|nr:amino acid ABC transporter ATP-binding protein [Aquicella lusitana]RDI42555.1 amino acid ABC transporter ATP-binding protein (PAAT family) [Aquicella lusitana]VVC74334.1 Octopine permease ATP-binding protein P [Aquicella lusitana]
MNKIKIENLYKSFNKHAILEGVSFTAQKGDVIALMGTSGSGKSTLLRCINLLTMPDGGTIQIDHQIMRFGEQDKTLLSNKEMIRLRKKVGMVFQQFNLWAHMTVLENLIAAPVHVLKQNKKQTVEEAKKLLIKVGLADKLHRYPAQLSGGQQQRAAIARALMMKPEIMLFDEPTSALDPEMVGEVLGVMQQLANEGMTMLVATHELNFARRVANQSIFLDGGKIIEHGDTVSMFSHPATARFRRFLEAMQH